MPIGKSDKTQSFTSHKVTFQKGDMIYFYTDGYPDQFGGPKGKKFKIKMENEHLEDSEVDDLLKATANSEDFAEGIASFQEKRDAVFKGR